MPEKQTKFWEDKVIAFKLASIKTFKGGINYFSQSISPLRADLPKSFSIWAGKAVPCGKFVGIMMLVSGGILTSWSPARSQNLRTLSCLTLSVNIKPCWAKSGMNTTDVSFFVSFKIESLVKILLNSVIRLIIEFLPRSQLICFCFRIGLMERSQKSQMQS